MIQRTVRLLPFSEQLAKQREANVSFQDVWHAHETWNDARIAKSLHKKYTNDTLTEEERALYWSYRQQYPSLDYELAEQTKHEATERLIEQTNRLTRIHRGAALSVDDFKWLERRPGLYRTYWDARLDEQFMKR